MKIMCDFKYRFNFFSFSGTHPASYPMGTRALSLEITSAEVKECLELYLHSPTTPSWRGSLTLFYAYRFRPFGLFWFATNFWNSDFLDIYVGLIGRVTVPSQGLYPHRKAQPKGTWTYGVITKSFRTESIRKCTITFGTTRWEATKMVMAAELTRLTHQIAIQLHLVTKSSTICSSRSRRPVRKLLDTPSYVLYYGIFVSSLYT
jgi:hypothetical protein